jgi:uncharacterized protein
VILFLDSSAVVKLFITETQSQEVIEAVDAAREVAVSTLTLAEVSQAITRHEKQGDITQGVSLAAYRNLLDDWLSLLRIPVDDYVAKEAAMYARNKGLRGADAVQLACAALLSREQKHVKFLSYDDYLMEVARTTVSAYEK